MIPNLPNWSPLVSTASTVDQAWHLAQLLIAHADPDGHVSAADVTADLLTLLQSGR